MYYFLLFDSNIGCTTLPVLFSLNLYGAQKLIAMEEQ